MHLIWPLQLKCTDNVCCGAEEHHRLFRSMPRLGSSAVVISCVENVPRLFRFNLDYPLLFRFSVRQRPNKLLILKGF